jgi:apolipoprotein N-acyltransferase
LQASVFRAVENGVYLVRAANTGISGFISPYGEVRTLVNEDAGRQTFISGYKTYDIALGRRQNTFYTEWGDWFVLVCLVFAVYPVRNINFTTWLSKISNRVYGILKIKK